MFVVASIFLLDPNYINFVLHFFCPMAPHFTQNKNITYDTKIQFQYVPLNKHSVFLLTVVYPEILFGGGSTNSVEDRGETMGIRGW